MYKLKHHDCVFTEYLGFYEEYTVSDFINGVFESIEEARKVLFQYVESSEVINQNEPFYHHQYLRYLEIVDTSDEDYIIERWWVTSNIDKTLEKDEKI